MRIIFLGDIVGRAGREAVFRHLPLLQAQFAPDFTLANGENAAHGFGINWEIYQALLAAGVDAVTLGNHAFDQRETLVFIEREPHLLRPANWPQGCPGRGATLLQNNAGKRLLVINAMGRAFMEPVLDDPFPVVSAAVETCPLKTGCDAIVLDFHAETTAEKMIMGHHLDGRVSLVVGTHTHVPTADCHILPHGTAYLTDAGMCGDYDSVIGMDKAEPLNRMLRKLPVEKFKPAEGEATVCGVALETDDATGLARKVVPFRVGGRLQQQDLGSF